MAAQGRQPTSPLTAPGAAVSTSPPAPPVLRSTRHQRARHRDVVNFDAKEDGTAWISSTQDRFDLSYCRLSPNGKQLTIVSFGGETLTCFFQDVPMVVALCMATHQRLGAFSPMSGLNSNILVTIADMLTADAVRSIHCQGCYVSKRLRRPDGAIVEYCGGREATVFHPHQTVGSSDVGESEGRKAVEVQSDSVSFSAVRRQFVAAVEPSDEEGEGEAAAEAGVVLALFGSDFREERRSEHNPRLIADDVSTSWSHNGARIASCGFQKTDNWPLQRPFGPARVWCAASLTALRFSVRPQQPDQTTWGECVHLVFCPSQPLLASVWSDRTLRIFAWEEGRVVEEEGGGVRPEEEEGDVWRLAATHALPSLLHCVAFDPSGSMLVGVSRKEGSQVRTDAFAVAVHDDGSIEACGKWKLPLSDSGPLSVSVAAAPAGCTAAVALEGVIDSGLGALVVLLPFRRPSGC